MMQSRHAAFAVLRRLALRDFAENPRKFPRWRPPAAQPFQPIAPRPFHHNARYHNQQQPTQTPPQVTSQETHKSKPPISPKGKSHAPPQRIPYEKQAYEMTFTCKPCGTRSSHRITKQGYHFGSVLITCPECKNRHIISDHLGIFTDKAGMTVEDFMKEKGQLVRKGTLSEDGDLEFWEDGTTTNRGDKEFERPAASEST